MAQLERCAEIARKNRRFLDKFSFYKENRCFEQKNIDVSNLQETGYGARTIPIRKPGAKAVASGNLPLVSDNVEAYGMAIDMLEGAGLIGPNGRYRDTYDLAEFEENLAARKARKPPGMGRKSRKEAGEVKKENVYNRWVKVSSPRVRADNPGIAPKEVFSTIAAEWNAMTDAQHRAFAEAEGFPPPQTRRVKVARAPSPIRTPTARPAARGPRQFAGRAQGAVSPPPVRVPELEPGTLETTTGTRNVTGRGYGATVSPGRPAQTRPTRVASPTRRPVSPPGATRRSVRV